MPELNETSATHPVTLIQFLPPWRSRTGFRRFRLDADGQLCPHKPVKMKKALRKPTRKIDGLLIRPLWPTRKGLALVLQSDTARIHAVEGDRLVTDSPAINLDDPTLNLEIAERGLYRRFTVSTDDQTLVFRDFAGRLIGPQRTAYQTFPEADFSPVSRLFMMLDDPALRRALLSDLARHKFDYARWINRPTAQTDLSTA